MIDLPVGASLVEEFLACVTGGDQLGSGVEPDRRDVVIIADGASTDDGDADGRFRVRHRVCSMRGLHGTNRADSRLPDRIWKAGYGPILKVDTRVTGANEWAMFIALGGGFFAWRNNMAGGYLRKPWECNLCADGGLNAAEEWSPGALVKL